MVVVIWRCMNKTELNFPSEAVQSVSDDLMWASNFELPLWLKLIRRLAFISSAEAWGRCSAEISEEQEAQEGVKSDCSPDLNSSPPSSPLPLPFLLLLLILLLVHSEAMRPEWNQWKQQRETNQDLQHGHLMMMMMIMIMCMNSAELDSKDFCFWKRFTKTCCIIPSQHLNTRTCRTNILFAAILSEPTWGSLCWASSSL